MKTSLLVGHDGAVIDFVSRLSPLEQPVWPEGTTAIGIIRGDGALIGGAVFSEYRPQFSTLQLSGAAVQSTAFGIQIVRQLGEYVFGQLDIHRLWARTSLRNERAKKFLRHVGFTQEAVLSHHFGSKHHACQWRILKPEWENLHGPIGLKKAA